MAEDAVTLELDGRIAIVRLNRPSAMNAVNDAVRQGLTRALKQLDAGDHADAIVLTGSGERAFCAGQDLEESAAITTDRLADWLNRQHAMYQAVRDVSKPVVAAINGTAAGAGFQMSLMCDLRVAHAGVKMGQPEVRAGLASIVGSYLMSLQIGHAQPAAVADRRAARRRRAHALGLVNDLVPQQEVLARALARARELAALPRAAVRATKQRFREARRPASRRPAAPASATSWSATPPAAHPRDAGFLARRQRKETP